MKDKITVTDAVERLLYSMRKPSHDWIPGSARQLPNGEWELEIDSEVRARLESLRFPSESDSDLLLRLCTYAQNKGKFQ